jgi:flagellar biosynthesis protein FlhF
MSTATEFPVVPGQCYKFIVNSAEEAVTVIRERLGERAQVLSVRQVEGEGFSRFLRAPKLQVIATVPEEEPAASASAATKPPQPTAKGVSSAKAAAATAAFSAARPRPDAEPGAGASEAGATRGRKSGPASAAAGTSGGGSAGFAVGEGRLWAILEKAGLPRDFLGRLGQRDAWRGLGDQPLPLALGRAALLLKEAVPMRSLALGRRVAFFGSPGAGATTALCKQLANDVFIQQRSPCVMKLDSDEPNSTEGLSTFCEVLGVPLLRSPMELSEVGEDTTLYFDVPGTHLTGASGERLRELLDAQKITSRVLVVNAAYDRELIQMAYTQAATLGGTHVVFTHLDELPRTGKLWEFALDEKLATLFASTGRNLAGDCEANLVELLVERTFAVACA